LINVTVQRGESLIPIFGAIQYSVYDGS